MNQTPEFLAPGPAKTSPPSLWPTFAKAYEAVTQHAPQDFKFEPGKAWMTTTTEVGIALVIYYTVILGGRELMRNRPKFDLNGLFKIHNFYLTVISGLLLALHLEQIVPTIFKNGLLFSICRRAGGWTQQLEVLYYLNYLTKYLELLDTVFLVLKKKPLTFLHTYHHGATALLCYTQLSGKTAISWVPITLNLMVHVVMYWYYFQAARGIKIWWKQYITVLQIVQFVIDLGFIYFAFYTELASSSYSWMGLPHCGRCEGEHYAAWWGAGIITSYLFLFIGFYLATYKKQPTVERKATKAITEMKTTEVADVKQVSEKMNGVLSQANGHSNGHANGYANGHVMNGHANGKAVNGAAVRPRRT